MDDKFSDKALAAYLRERGSLIALAYSVAGNSHVAEDLVQDCWLRWSQRDYPEDKAGPILARILKNLAIDWRRRRTLEFEVLEAQRVFQDHSPDVERAVIARERLTRVVKALQELPPRTLLAFRCSRVECLTLKETGRRLGVSESRASQLVADAIVHIAAALPEND
ncbi:MAG: sigma-70 family RNA polymerase sigma factor [Pseudomonadota bacterium]